MQGALVRRIAAWSGVVQKLGPYLLIEIVLPGGTLIALLLFLYQRKGLTEGAIEMPAAAWAIGALRAVYQRVRCWIRLGNCPGSV